MSSSIRPSCGCATWHAVARAMALAFWLSHAIPAASILAADSFNVVTRPIAWQQVEQQLTFHFFIERELYTSLDRSARMVLAVEAERAGHQLGDLTTAWTIESEQGAAIARGTAKLDTGGIDITFPLAQLAPGRYTVAAQLMKSATVLAEKSGPLRYESRQSPPQSGKVALLLPRGVPLSQPAASTQPQTWPVHAGVPFPKGVLWDARQVRVVDASGAPVDADVTVRGRWDHSEQGSIRWLGVQFQPKASEPDWPRGEARYHLEFGWKVARPAPQTTIKVADTPEAITIDTGAANLSINRKKFNVINSWSLNAGGASLQADERHGLYLVDHKGTTYRAANDRAVEVSIEERSDMHVVVRAAGWYVRDGAPADPTQNLTLPTDKLCRFVTRIEAYAGKPYVRVMNTLIITFDTFNVRLRDAGMSLPMAGAKEAKFGIEVPTGAMPDPPPSQGGAGGGSGDQRPAAAEPSPTIVRSTLPQPLPEREGGDATGTRPHTVKVSASGVRGVQHLHNAFTIEDGEGRSLAEAQRSAGWVTARGNGATLAMSLRDTWQRYPKELEVLPDAVKLHVWPAHGRTHPQINELARDQMHKVLFAHQGQELNMAAPWDYFIKACDYYNADSYGVYTPTGHLMAAVHASGLGTATTSDVLIELGSTNDETSLARHAECFQQAPHAVADPVWTCDSLALGQIHPYDPAMFPTIEQVIHDAMRGYWKYQDMGEMFGMWIYRSWLHSGYRGNGAWELYRLYNGTHHQEAIIPWLLYARSGDPFYLTQGMANIRQLTDVQMKHHADDRYTHRELAGQRSLVGSTVHTNSLSPWGNDHGILGHLACNNAAITAYYLTGDLRLREVVVDEWANTLLTQRGTREYINADRSNTAFKTNPRDNSNAIAEIIDVYQLTYDPRLLALLAPRYDIWANSPGCMGVDWGQPMHHEQLFRGSAVVREKLLAGAAALRDNKMDYNQSIARPVNAPQELFAMAGIVDPGEPWAFHAVAAANLHQIISWSSNRITQSVNDVFSNTGEFILHLPRVMYALANSSRPEAARVLGAGQPSPRTTGPALRVVIREDTDQAFKVYFHGDVKQANGFDLRVLDPTGNHAAMLHVSPGMQAVELTVPLDGKTGQYVLFMGATQNDDHFAPYTTLPEVYVTTFYAGHYGQSRFFTRSPGSDAVEMTFTPHKGPGAILSADRQTTLAETKSGEAMKLKVGAEGVWIWNRSGYMNASRGKDQPIILAVTPDRWFMPNEQSLTVKPAQ